MIFFGEAMQRRAIRAEPHLYLWDKDNGKQVRQFKGHTSDVRTAAVSPNGKQLLSGSFDGTMRLWDMETGKELRKFAPPCGFGSCPNRQPYVPCIRLINGASELSTTWS
jgi:WD40 repeat protein